LAFSVLLQGLLFTSEELDQLSFMKLFSSTKQSATGSSTLFLVGTWVYLKTSTTVEPRLFCPSLEGFYNATKIGGELLLLGGSSNCSKRLALARLVEV